MTRAQSRKRKDAARVPLTRLGLKAKRWLDQLADPKPIATKDPRSAWHFRATYPAGSSHVMHVASPHKKPDTLIIASVLTITQTQFDAFSQLPDESKENLLWALRFRLNSVETDFRLDGVAGPLDCPTRILTSVVRYEDGLSLDSFARSLGAVYKTELLASWTIFRHLSREPHVSMEYR